MYIYLCNTELNSLGNLQKPWRETLMNKAWKSFSPTWLQISVHWFGQFGIFYKLHQTVVCIQDAENNFRLSIPLPFPMGGPKSILQIAIYQQLNQQGFKFVG